MNQTKLKVFKGITIPFNEAQEDLVRKQFLHATISHFAGPRMLRLSNYFYSFDLQPVMSFHRDECWPAVY